MFRMIILIKNSGNAQDDNSGNNFRNLQDDDSRNKSGTFSGENSGNNFVNVQDDYSSNNSGNI